MDYIDEGMIDVSHMVKHETIWQKFGRKLDKHLKKLPVEKVIVRIKQRFDKSTISFFLSYQFLLRWTIVIAIIFTPLMLMQLNNTQFKMSDQCFGMPCFSIYSRFRDDLDLAYSATIFFFLVTGLIGFMAKWTDFDKLAKQNSFFGNKKYPISG